MNQKNADALEHTPMGVVDRVTRTVKTACGCVRPRLDRGAGQGLRRAVGVEEDHPLHRAQGLGPRRHVHRRGHLGVAGGRRPRRPQAADDRRLTARPAPSTLWLSVSGRAIGRVGRAFWRWVWALEDIGVYVGVVEDDYDNGTAEGRKKRASSSLATTPRPNTRSSASAPRAGCRRRPRTGGGRVASRLTAMRSPARARRASHACVQCAAECAGPQGDVGAGGRGRHERERAGRASSTSWVSLRGRACRGRPRTPRAKLLSESTLNARVIFRNPNRTRAGHGAKFGRDGKPLNGEPGHPSSSIPSSRRRKWPPSSRPWGGWRTASRSRSPRRTRCRSACSTSTPGATRTTSGMARTSRGGRWYRCTGLAAKYPGRRGVRLQDGRCRRDGVGRVGRGRQPPGQPAPLAGDGG
ncbi:Recombinase OS=Streptomyces microflavus OX=1919 GN=Smic_61110 PE=4 SV=1 [Streptomyces microflavus]